MEAMIYQVPIISNNIPGVRDLVKNMENGILCEIDDVKCYVNSIKKLLLDKDLKDKFKEMGINLIKSRYLWKNNIKNFESIYEKII